MTGSAIELHLRLGRRETIANVLHCLLGAGVDILVGSHGVGAALAE